MPVVPVQVRHFIDPYLDMMLAGKSLQVIAFLHTLFGLPEDGPAPLEQEGSRTLLVAPMNVLANWQEEFRIWLPRPSVDAAANFRQLTLEKVQPLLACKGIL